MNEPLSWEMSPQDIDTLYRQERLAELCLPSMPTDENRDKRIEAVANLRQVYEHILRHGAMDRLAGHVAAVTVESDVVPDLWLGGCPWTREKFPSLLELRVLTVANSKPFSTRIEPSVSGVAAAVHTFVSEWEYSRGPPMPLALHYESVDMFKRRAAAMQRKSNLDEYGVPIIGQTAFRDAIRPHIRTTSRIGYMGEQCPPNPSKDTPIGIRVSLPEGGGMPGSYRREYIGPRAYDSAWAARKVN